MDHRTPTTYAYSIHTRSTAQYGRQYDVQHAPDVCQCRAPYHWHGTDISQAARRRGALRSRPTVYPLVSENRVPSFLDAKLVHAHTFERNSKTVVRQKSTLSAQRVALALSLVIDERERHLQRT